MLRRLFAVLLAVGLFAALSGAASAQQRDQRYFQQTRYRIDDDRFWDYFQKRGGVRTFGYPVSNAFPLLGQFVQIFQRQIMQIQPDGAVATMNLLDEGLMPYTRINGSAFPAIDPEVVRKAPSVKEADYHARALQFVKDFAPDVWQGRQVNFYATFQQTVRFEEAFPDGKGERGLMPGFNLEMWGLPTSRPTPDPTNGGFIYLRFQRGIMHYDASTGTTQGLLLGEYIKAVITLRGLPPDLEEQARSSRFFGQLAAPGVMSRVARPRDLPGTDLSNAFRRDPLVVLDPGHGGKEIGSSFTFPDGLVLVEKELTLKVAQKTSRLLGAAGLETILTRTTDRQVNEPPRDLTGDDKINVSDDLQARIDLANSAGADLLLSMHFNGSANPAARGTQVFYSDGRPFSERSKALADLTNAAIVKALAEAGYPTSDRKAATDRSVLGGESHFYLLGPQGDAIKRPSQMPAVLAEPLYLTNPDDANALRQERILDALAKAYDEGVRQYFARFPAG